MSEFRSDQDMPLDATVNSMQALDEPAAVAPAYESALRVYVSGDEASEAAAPGLAEDIRLLIQEFFSRPVEERQEAPERTRSSQHPDIQISLIGLRLDPGEEAPLHDLIHAFIHKRVRNEGTEP